MSSIVTLYQSEQEMLKKYEKFYPGLVTPRRNFSYKEILARIGITVSFGNTPQGYLNLYPQDFIVEEIDKDGVLHTIEPESSPFPAPQSGKDGTLYVDLVKVGLSSIEAAEAIADALCIPRSSVSYAGIKDKPAVTSQRIAIRHAAPENAAQLSVPGLFLKNFCWGKGCIERGRLRGNRFVITVRTAEQPSGAWLESKLNEAQGGFYNFYFLQRFGSPRLISHVLGMLLLKQNYRGVLETAFCENGAQDVPLIRNLRKNAHDHFGNWRRMKEIFSYLPYTFREELFLLQYLKEHPEDHLGALKTIQSQLTLWIYAYSSYLFNRHLSHLVNTGREIPPELPLLLHPAAQENPAYAAKLMEDGIADITRALVSVFGYNPIKSKNVCPTKASVSVTHIKILEKGVKLAFELPVGSYATTFLSHLFEIYRGMPLPEWLDMTKYDAKKGLGIGSVEAVERVLGDHMFSRAVLKKAG